jgi:hypothetical protein
MIIEAMSESEWNALPWYVKLIKDETNTKKALRMDAMRTYWKQWM